LSGAATAADGPCEWPVDTAAKLGIKKDDLYLDRDRARQAAHESHAQQADARRRSSPFPNGWWLPEAPGPDHGVFEVCSNVLVDDDLDNCDIALGSSPLKAMLCRVSRAEAPARTVTARWKDATGQGSPRNERRGSRPLHDAIAAPGDTCKYDASTM